MEENNEKENNKTEIAPQADNAPAKKKREPKSYPAKKLPRLFRKRYAAKKFERKLLRRIAITEDRELVRSLFEQDAQKADRLSVPQDKRILAGDMKRLRRIAKQIKSQKGRVKFVRIGIAVAAVLALLTAVNLFKNVIAKKAITVVMQNAFGARCDIGSVSVRFLDTSLTINNLAQANRRKPMRNIFETSKIVLDFDIWELLKAKFVIDEISCLDMRFNTDRKVSGELPYSENYVAQIADSRFVAAIKEKSLASYDETRRMVEDLFDQYNPVKMLENTRANLVSPEVAQKALDDSMALIEKWKAVPGTYEASAEALREKVEQLRRTDINAIKQNPLLVTSTIQDIQAVIEEGNRLKSTIEQTASDIKADANSVAQMTKDISDAVRSDTDMAMQQVRKLTSFNLNDGKSLLKSAVDNVGYQFLGKYYPYLEAACKKAMESKGEKPAEPEKKERRTLAPPPRASGRWVFYRRDNVPKFLLRKCAASGDGFSAVIKDVSSDMNRYGRPAVAEGALTLAGLSHAATVTVDLRDSSKEPVFRLDYNGSGFRSDIDFADYIDVKGMPALHGSTSLSGTITADVHAYFTARASAALSDVSMSVEPFEPELVSTIYRDSLAGIQAFRLGALVGYTEDGLNFDIDTDLDTQLKASLYASLNRQLDVLKSQAIARIEEELNARTKGALEAIGGFNGLVERLRDSEALVDALNKELQARVAELRSNVGDRVNEELQKAKDEASAKAQEAVNEAAGKAQEQVKDAIGNALGGFLKKQ